jgi:16S rRNA (uracil1498-N3)-methyltransferase
VIWISNGQGMLFQTKIIEAHEKKCLVQVVKSEYHAADRKYRLHIAIAPTKLNDRFEWFLEKATEIGIDEITPLICMRSERKQIKIERMKKIITAAAKQSLSFHIPILNESISYSEFVQIHSDNSKFIAHCMDSERQSFKELLVPEENITILIGPEGDFTMEELQLSLEHKYIPVSLGQSRLRTETAGIVAAHSVAYCNQH